MILAGGSEVTTRNKSRVSIDLGNTRLKISSAHYTPDIRLNLISCSRLDEHRISTSFSEKESTIMDRHRRNKRLAVVHQRDSYGLYVVSALESRRKKVLNLYTMEKEKHNPEQNSLKFTVALWHDRIGHGNKKAIGCMTKSESYGTAVIDDGGHTKSETCTRTKATNKLLRRKVGFDESYFTAEKWESLNWVYETFEILCEDQEVHGQPITPNLPLDGTAHT